MTVDKFTRNLKIYIKTKHYSWYFKIVKIGHSMRQHVIMYNLVQILPF